MLNAPFCTHIVRPICCYRLKKIQRKKKQAFPKLASAKLVDEIDSDDEDYGVEETCPDEKNLLHAVQDDELLFD